MKKIYLFAVLFLSVLSHSRNYDLFANSVKANNTISNPTVNVPAHWANAIPGATCKTDPTPAVPITNMTASTISICEGETLTLIANPTGGVAPFTYIWNGPNGFISTLENPTINNVTTSNAGNYTLQITDANLTIYNQSTDVIVNTKADPTFDAILPAICKGESAPVLSTISSNGITGNWSPSVVSNTATGTYIFTPNNGQCANSLSLTVFVINNVTPVFTLPASICQGETSPVLSNTSNNGIVGSWNPTTVSNISSGSYVFTPSTKQCAIAVTINITVNPKVIPSFNPIAPICENAPAPILPTTSTNNITGTWNSAVSNTVSGTYTFTPTSGQCTTTTTLSVTVNPNITPTFTAIGPICSGATSPVLPTTSNNGYTGTWNPAIVSNTASGTYTFTPTSGQCATTTTMNITVSPNVTPIFDPIADVCYNSKVPLLPLVSNNGIAGTWNPSIISNTNSATYTFTPNAGQCATTTTLSAIVNTITPSFMVASSICKDAPAPILPTTSTNNITGTWNPATVNNTTTGTYTFTPDADQCAIVVSITITVNPNIIPTFTAIGPLCYGSAAPSLPTTSTNGYTGTWNPATISNTDSAIYTFTPDTGQCATTATLNITVTKITPTFNAVAPICENAPAPILPTTSTNGITGTWDSAVSNSTTGTYTFTPDVNQCALTTTLTVTVNPNITPTFTAVAPICSSATRPVLPTTSNNGYTGTWSPATVDNQNSATYTFTPTSGQCALTTTLSVTVNPNITPTFTAIAPICSGTAIPILPTTSNNGYAGTWNPPTVSNTTTGTYTFTPNAGQCAVNTTLNVTVTPIVIPTFSPIPDVCYGSTAPTLPTTSNNGIVGTWNPATVSNTNSATYTFTPDAGQCATTATLNITVTKITPSFNAIAPICENAPAPILPTTSTNGITGTWDSAVSNTTSGTYSFTPDAGQCAVTTTLNVTVNPYVAATFTAIAPICSGATSPLLPTTSNNGYTGTWSPATISNTTSAIYSFTPSAGQCTFATTMSVTVIPKVTPTFTAIAPICSGSSSPVLPTTSINGIAGTWSPTTVSNNASGTYTFNPSVGLCALPTILNITVYQSPTAILTKTTDVVNEGPDGIIEITGVTSGLSPYQYSINNSGFTTTLIYANLLPGNYTVTVKDTNGCEFSKIVTINSICFFPNAISPNEDNFNDTFNLKGCNIVKLELFNRYGRKINTFSNYTDQWDGKSSGGEALPDGTYYYVAEDNGGKVNTGWVFIAR